MENVKIELTYGTAYVLKQLVEYTIIKCEEQAKLDPLKDNGYIMRACREYLNAIDESEDK